MSTLPVSVTVSNASGSAIAAASIEVTATAGTPQYPNLLQGFAHRPSWQVVGVDNYVGVPVGTVLKDPATISKPGVTVNIANKEVIVGSNNVTLDGYLFSDWTVSVRAANTRIVNSRFAVGAKNRTPVFMTNTGVNLYVGYCSIDGVGHDPSPYGGLITWLGSGITVEYCYLGNSAGDILQAQGGPGGPIVIRYNFMEQAGTGAGAHGDLLQVFSNTNPTAIINFNTVRQDGGFTQGFIVENTSAGEIGNNTFVGGGDLGQAMGLERDAITGTFTTHDNYFADLKYGFAHGWAGGAQPNDSNPKTVFTHNVNMRTGGLVQDT